MPLRAYLITVIVWTILSSPLKGQDLLLKHIDVEQGLPSSTVYRLFVDHTGFIWMATAAGVYRYDGHRFEHIGEGSPLDQLVLHHFFQTGPDRIWFACTSGRLLFWDGRSVTEVAATGERVRGELRDPGICSLLSDGSGGVLFGFPSTFGMGSITAQGAVDWPVVAPAGLHVRRTPHGILCFETIDGPAVLGRPVDIHYQGERRSYSIPAGPLTQGAGMQRNHAIERRDRTVLLAIGDRVLALSDTGYGVFFQGRQTILRVVETADRRVLIVYQDGGTVVLRSDGTPSGESLASLARLRVSDIAQDQQGGFWISTLGNGSYYATSSDCTKPRLPKDFNTEDITALSIDPSGITWLGTHHGECIALDTADNVLGRWRLPPSNLTREIRAFCIDPVDGSMLASTAIGIARIAGHTLELIRPSDANSWYGHGLVHRPPGHALVMSSRGVADIELRNGGSCRWMRPGERFHGAMSGAGDTTWLWSVEGLRYHTGDSVYDFHAGDTLLDTPVHDRVEFAGAVWLATARSGALRIQGNGSAEYVPLMAGPGIVRATCLQPLGDSLLIVGSVQGLFRVDLRDPERMPARIDRNWGLPSEVIRDIGFDGRQLRVLTEQGLITIDPRAFELVPPTQPLLLLSTTLRSGSPVQNGDRLQHTDDQLHIRFCHLNFRDHGHQLFRYRVLGLSEHWTQTNVPDVQLLALAPGDYTFEVSGRNPEGTWTRPLAFQWTIAPAFWQTWWFRGLCTALAIAVIVLVVLWLMRQRARRTELEERVLTHHQAALLALMDPHFIFNSLNSVQSFIARNDTDRSLRYMGRFSRLMRGLLNAGREQEISLRQEVDLLEQYCSLEALRFDPPFHYTIEAGDLPMDRLMVPAYLIQPHVENAIRHGLWPLRDRRGELHIRFEGTRDNVHCTVTDNGIGRAAARAQHTPHNNRSEGMRIQQERIVALNSLSRRGGIRVAIIDEHDHLGNAAGTIVRIVIPRNERTDVPDNSVT